MRVVSVVVLVAAGFGPSGAAVGVLIGEVVATAHARWASVRSLVGRPGTAAMACRAGWVAALRPDPVLAGGSTERRTVALDLAVASISLSMVAVLQNVEVLVVGRRIAVAPPGVDTRFTPGGQRSPTPLVVAVGRLVPVKRFDALLRELVKVKRAQPDLQAVIIGEGHERPALEALRAELGVTEWVSLPGHVEDDELVSWYQRAGVVASSSQREGWGMTLTEAGACGTPAVATDIAGHADAVVDGESGLLVDDVSGLPDALGRVLADDVLRSRLSKGALARARWFTWDASARRALEALAGEAMTRS